MIDTFLKVFAALLGAFIVVLVAVCIGCWEVSKKSSQDK